MKSLSSPKFYVLAAALLTLIVFFSARFLRKGTADETAGPTSHSEATTGSTSEHSTAGNESGESTEPPPDKTIAQLVQTWNRGSAEEIATLFASDGTLVIPSGSQIRSRAEIQKTISEKRAGVLKETVLTNTVDEITRPDPNTALVLGTYKLDGIKILGVSTSATGSYKLRQVKHNGRWIISRAELVG